MGGEGKANTQDSRILRLKLMQWSVPIGTHQYPTGLMEFLNAPIPDTRGWCLRFGLLKFFVLIFLIRALSSWKASAIRNEYFSCFWIEIQIKRERALLDRSLDIKYCARHFTIPFFFIIIIIVIIILALQQAGRVVGGAVLVPLLGIKQAPPAVETQSSNHWNTREGPLHITFQLGWSTRLMLLFWENWCWERQLFCPRRGSY